MSVPTITVLMPVFNAEQYLRQAIESILNQTFSDFEFLIINDGSTDNSEQIILSYYDNRIRYVKNTENIKLIATLNKGIELSRGKYIARMDADDISKPHRLQTQFNFMEANKAVAICGSWFETIGNKEVIVKYAEHHNDIVLKMLYQCHFCHPTVIIRREMINTSDIKFDPKFIHAEDYDFFVRVGKKFQLANIQEALLKYRVHSQSVSTQYKDIQEQNSIIIKRQLFNSIGVDVTTKEIDLYRAISQYEYRSDETFIQEAKLFLEKLTKANDSSKVIEVNFLRRKMGEFWFNVVNNSITKNKLLIKYYSSFLSNYRLLSIIEKAKLLLKSHIV